MIDLLEGLFRKVDEFNATVDDVRLYVSWTTHSTDEPLDSDVIEHYVNHLGMSLVSMATELQQIRQLHRPSTHTLPHEHSDGLQSSDTTAS